MELTANRNLQAAVMDKAGMAETAAAEAPAPEDTAMSLLAKAMRTHLRSESRVPEEKEAPAAKGGPGVRAGA